MAYVKQYTVDGSTWFNAPVDGWTAMREMPNVLFGVETQPLSNDRLFRAVRDLQTLESTGSDLQDAIDELVAATRERFPEFEKETK